MEFLKLKGNFLDFKSTKFKIAVGTILGLILLIFIWGHFYSVAKVPWPDTKFPEFPFDKYKEAGEFFDKETQFVLFNEKTVAGYIREILEKGVNSSSDEYLFEKINISFRYKNVVINKFSRGFNTAEINAAFKKKTDNLNRKIKDLETELEEASYFDRNSISYKISDAKRELSRVNNFKEQVNKTNLYLDTDSVLGSKLEDFTWIAGKYENISKRSYTRFRLSLTNVRPIVTKKFFTKNGLPGVLINEESLKNQRKSLSGMKKEALKKYEAKKDSRIREISRRINDRRSVWKERFYKKWYSILLMAIISFIMVQFLAWYYSIIRRKDLPKKITHEVYFATNVTSKVFRIIALIIIVLGLIALLINLVRAMIYTQSSIPMFRSIGFFYGFISPILITISTVIFSWWSVLASEFICFISNCYHVMFMRSYKESEIVKRD